MYSTTEQNQPHHNTQTPNAAYLEHPGEMGKATIQAIMNDDMPSQAILVLLHVARNPNLKVQELAKVTGLTSSTTSRNVAALGRTHRNGRPGLDLVVAYHDPEDGQHIRVDLTPTGKQCTETLIHNMGVNSGS